MSTDAVAGSRLRRSFGSPRVRLWAAVLAVETLAVVTYFVLSDAAVGEVRYLLYPFVWTNVGAWAVLRTDATPGSRTHQTVAGAVGALYFLGVMAVPGNVGPGTAATLETRVTMYAPGWGPLVAVDGPWLRLYLVPFEVVGYLALSYLVYAALLRVTHGALSGLLGLLTCVGCTVPLAAPLLGLLGGPATGLATTAFAWSYDIGTLLYGLTVGLLTWSLRRHG